MLVLKGQMIRTDKILCKYMKQGLHQMMKHLGGVPGRKAEFPGHDLDDLGEARDIRRIKGLSQRQAEGTEPGQVRRGVQIKMNPVIIVIRMMTAIVDIGITGTVRLPDGDDHRKDGGAYE